MYIEELSKKLVSGKPVFIEDEYEEAIVKFVYDKDEKRTRTWIKRKGIAEHEIPQSEEIVLEIQLGGKEVDKDRYDKY